MQQSPVIVCNCSSFCINPDCNYYHNISMKERKIVRKLYDAFGYVNKDEVNLSSRKANCKFGQLCFNHDCGYRHRLSPDYRTKLSNAFNDAKLQSTKIEKVPMPPKSHIFIIPNKNSFLSLDIIEPVDIIPIPAKTSWADIV